MVKRITIGDKQKIIEQMQELSEYKILVNNLADKDLAGLITWFNQNFSEFSQAQKGQLLVLVKTQWACAKGQKKMWSLLKDIKTD